MSHFGCSVFLSVLNALFLGYLVYTYDKLESCR